MLILTVPHLLVYIVSYYSNVRLALMLIHGVHDSEVQQLNVMQMCQLSSPMEFLMHLAKCYRNVRPALVMVFNLSELADPYFVSCLEHKVGNVGSS